MKILLTLSEYAKLKGLSEIAIRKQVSKNYTKSINLDDIMYIIHEDDRLEKAKQTIKNKCKIWRVFNTNRGLLVYTCIRCY